MKKLTRVFKKDLKNIIENPVACIIIVGICVIPALYAWVNIKACWDPYSNTSTMPIAVVNSDKGGTIAGEKMNVGKEVVDELKNNKNIAWKFVSKKEADMGVVDGTYFASIEIPETFSKDLASIATNKTKKAEITYKLDTKANPVAGKIAGGAEEYLVDEITSNFIATVNKKAFEKIHGYNESINKNRNDIIKLKNSIVTVSKNLDTIIAALENVKANSTNLNNYLKVVQSTMPALTEAIDVSETTSLNTEELINSTNNSLTASIKTLNENLNETKVSIDKITAVLDNASSEQSTPDISNELNNINKEIGSINNNLNSIIEFLQAINKVRPNEKIAEIIVNLELLQSKLKDQSKLISSILDSTLNGKKANNEALQQLKDNLHKISKDLGNTASNFENSTIPVLNEITSYLTNVTKDATALLRDSQGVAGGMNTIINSATEGSGLTAKISGDTLSQLKEYEDEIKYIGAKLAKIDDNDLDTIITVLENNPDLVGKFLSNPFNLKEVRVYSVPNYGSAMAPIYSVLAIWVGGLILTSVLKTETKDFKGIEELSIRYKYFGKMVLFVVLAIIQGTIIALGNIFLLKIYVVNAFLLTIFAILSAITFSIIIFTNVSLLGNVGKAVNIIFMIIQLAGCGGSYPIQVDPIIFRILQPLFPFTYSVGGFREAIAGPLGSSVALDIIMLLSFCTVYIILGYIFKPRLHSIVNRFEKKFHESGIGE